MLRRSLTRLLTLLTMALAIHSPARANVVGDFLGGGSSFTTFPWIELAPSVHGAFEWSREYVNLTPNPDPDRLHAYDFSGGFRVTRKRIVEAGVGPTFDWNFLDAVNIVPFVGILPLVGTRVIESRYAPSEEAAKKLAPVRGSVVPKFLKTWHEGDHVTYQASGGILFSAGLSIYGLGVSTRYLAKGDWVVYVEKLADSRAYVKITKTRLTSMSVNAGAAIIGVSSEWFRNADNYFSFVVDLNHDHAVRAFADVLKGNLTEAQRISELEDGPIRLDTSARVEQAGKRVRFWYGLTWLLGGQISNGTISTHENEWHFDKDLRVRVNHGVWFKENMSRVFLKRERQIEAFYATHHTLSYPEVAGEEPFRTHTGTFYFTYENNRTGTDDLANALRYLIRRTGLRRELTLGMPPHKKIDSTLTQFKLVLSHDATETLMRLAWDRELHFLDSAVRNAVDTYFAGGDAERLCARLSVGNCRAKYLDDTRRTATEMKTALTRMAATVDLEPSDFVKAYAEFGKAMRGNRFTIQAVLDIVEGDPIEFALLIEGPKVARFERKIGRNPEADRSRSDFIAWRIRQIAQGKRR